jgi:hypothetical protein
MIFEPGLLTAAIAPQQTRKRYTGKREYLKRLSKDSIIWG